MSSIVIFGNPVDGTEFVGPFEDAEAANEFADNERDSRDWWVATLAPPPAEWDTTEDDSDVLPEGLRGEVIGTTLTIYDAQDIRWVTVHEGGNGDPETWRATIRRRILTALGLPYKASAKHVYTDYHDQANGDH